MEGIRLGDYVDLYLTNGQHLNGKVTGFVFGDTAPFDILSVELNHGRFIDIREVETMTGYRVDYESFDNPGANSSWTVRDYEMPLSYPSIVPLLTESTKRIVLELDYSRWTFTRLEETETEES